MRSRTIALSALLLGGALALISSAQPWWRAVGAGAKVSFTGTDASAGLSQVLALVVLAGLLLALTLRSLGRRVLAVILILTGGGVGLVGALRVKPSEASVKTRLREVSLIDQYELLGTAWPWVYAAAGAVVVAAAVVMFLRASRWPQRPDRFQRASASQARVVIDENDPATLWKAMDAGIDPTSPPDETTSDSGETMMERGSGDQRDSGGQHDSSSQQNPSDDETETERMKDS